MSTQSPNNLTTDQAKKILDSFSCLDSKLVESESEKTLLRQSLLLIAGESDYQNLGICADSAKLGFLALEAYLQALGYKSILNPADITLFIGPVYIKFNTQKESYYLDTYMGKYRGVLVSCQSSNNEIINGTYGHLPLDLFTNDDKKP